MPKRFSTPDPEIKQYADKNGNPSTYVLRIGDKERSLETTVWEIAVKRKVKVKAKLDATGDLAGKLTCDDIFPDYESDRSLQLEAVVLAVVTGRAERRRKTISPGTFKEIKDLWRLHLGKFFGKIRMEKLSSDLEDLWDEYCDQATVIDLANHRKVFQGFLKWCRRKRYIKYVPELEIPAVDRRERRVLKPHEIKILFTHAKGSLLIFISMYLFMGMRRKEIMTLRWSGIFLDEGYLVLNKSEVKTRKGRPLPINAFVLGLLRQRKSQQQIFKSDFVFPNRDDHKRHADIGGLKTAWNTCIGRCKWETGYITPHDLRATFEAYAHKSTAFTDTQREKFAGAAIDVQKKTYVRFNADDIRGLEEVVKVEGLSQILASKIKQLGNQRGTADHDMRH